MVVEREVGAVVGSGPSIAAGGRVGMVASSEDFVAVSGDLLVVAVVGLGVGTVVSSNDGTVVGDGVSTAFDSRGGGVARGRRRSS